MAPVINVLLNTFPGLGLPSTLCVPLPADISTSDAVHHIISSLPGSLALSPIRLVTTSNKVLRPKAESSALSSFLNQSHHVHGTSSFLPLTLIARTLGGKGGFGSQLRAAGGRMSSKKKRQQGDVNASSRNLDGRRLRTVGEAKALAEYLAVKPDMEKKEKEERRRRWEGVVEASERTKEAIREGKGKARVDGKWIEEKEDVESKVRDEIREAMAKGLISDAKLDHPEVGSSEESVEGSEGSESSTPEVDEHMDDADGIESSRTAAVRKINATRKVYGWDDDASEDDDSEEES